MIVAGFVKPLVALFVLGPPVKQVSFFEVGQDLEDLDGLSDLRQDLRVHYLVLGHCEVVSNKREVSACVEQQVIRLLDLAQLVYDPCEFIDVDVDLEIVGQLLRQLDVLHIAHEVDYPL